MSRATRRILAVVAALALVGAACREAQPRAERPSENAGFPVTLTDDEGVELSIESEPQRIVTFAPSHTEILFGLGEGDRVVGVSGEFDDYPPEARAIETVGGAGGVEPNIEKVVSLQPDVLLTAFIGGEWKQRLRDLGIPVFTTLAASFDDTLHDIELVGRLIGVGEEAVALTETMEADAEGVAEDIGDRPRLSCFLDLADLFTVGPGSLEFDLLQRAGCDPVTASAGQPYPQWSVERLVRDDPDVYLISEGQTVQEIASAPGIRDLPAVRDGRVRPVDPDLISRPGPRVVQGLREVAAALYGD